MYRYLSPEDVEEYAKKGTEGSAHGKHKGHREKLLETYEIESQGIETKIEIAEKTRLPFYCVKLPEIGMATTALLLSIRERLLLSFTINAGAFFDPKLMDELKGEFVKEARILLDEELSELDEAKRNYLAMSLLNETLGLGDLEYFLLDDNIEEIVVNSTKEPVRIYHKKYGWMKTNIKMESEEEILGYANIIARRVGKEINMRNPRLDAHLVTGDRVNATLNPISNKGHTITIRKFSRNPWTATDFIKNGTISIDVLALIWEAMQYEMNVIVSGGTGSGKTSFLNICMPFIPPTQRIISIEDTKELQLPEFLHWCPLTTREPNPEGEGEVSMLDLLINSLRMRPDRIVMGEIRRQEEAEVLFEAMHTGHSVYSTLHADTCGQTISRLTNPPINIPHAMLEAVDLNIVMFRDRKTGLRRALEIGEFARVVNDDTSDLRFKPNVLYRWNPRRDTIDACRDQVAIYGRIALTTGLSIEEISAEIERKKLILEWMTRKHVRELEDVGRLMNLYYLDMDVVDKAAENDIDPKDLLNEVETEEPAECE